MTETTNFDPGHVRAVLSEALREEIAVHRATYPGSSGAGFRGGMQRALHIVETTPIPAVAAAPAAPELPSTVYVVRARLDIDHPDEGVYLSRDAAMAAARRIAVGFAGNPGAVWERVSPSETGWVGFGCGDGLVVSAGPEPLRDAPGPDEVPVVDEAAVTAALGESLPRNLPEDTAQGLSFRDALASFYAYVDDEDGGA